jgi:hypothetical protein
MAGKIATGLAHPILQVAWEGIDELGGEESFLASVRDPATVFSPSSFNTPRLSLDFDGEEDTVQLSGGRGGRKTIKEILRDSATKKRKARLDAHASHHQKEQQQQQQRDTQQNKHDITDYFEAVDPGESTRNDFLGPFPSRVADPATDDAAALQPPSRTAVTFNHYKSALISDRFETLARRRGRVGIVTRSHQWGEAEAEGFAKRYQLQQEQQHQSPDGALSDKVFVTRAQFLSKAVQNKRRAAVERVAKSKKKKKKKSLMNASTTKKDTQNQAATAKKNATMLEVKNAQLSVELPMRVRVVVTEGLVQSVPHRRRNSRRRRKELKEERWKMKEGEEQHTQQGRQEDWQQQKEWRPQIAVVYPVGGLDPTGRLARTARRRKDHNWERTDEFAGWHDSALVGPGEIDFFAYSAPIPFPSTY